MSGSENFAAVVELCRKAEAAAAELALSTSTPRTDTLLRMSVALEGAKQAILSANELDCAEAGESGLSWPLLKRLRITGNTFSTMQKRINAAANLPDPLGVTLSDFRNPQGMRVKKISTPIGVIAMIYESRPNVTTDCAAACLRSGNAVILRGGSESLRTNREVVNALRSAFTDLPADAVQLFDFAGHEAVDDLLQMSDYVDLLVPRGGRALIEAVESKSKIPLMRHYDGICHQYIAEDADLETALAVVINSKCQRYEVCNSLETLLIDAKCAQRVLPAVCEAFFSNGVEVRGCGRCCEIVQGLVSATEEDWSAEYLDAVISVRIVDGIKDACAHIAKYGSGHTDGIITRSEKLVDEFIARVDSGSVMVNASTRLSGGEAYNMGAVIGISTGKLHARGPVGPAELTSYKWVSLGDGHLRA